MVEFLTIDFLGSTVRQWLYALSFVLAGFVVGKLCAFILGLVAKHVSTKTKNTLDDALIKALKAPSAVLIFIGGILFALSMLSISTDFYLVIRRIITSSVIVVSAWCINRLISIAVSKLIPARSQGLVSQKEIDIQPVVRKLFYGIVWILAVILVLRNFGYNVSTLLAGLGLGGAALALASRDTLANFFGSIVVFIDRPFRINDRIKVAGYDGYITEMSLRTSRIRTLENRVVVIPNSIFSSSPIENISAEPNTKVTQVLTVKRDNGIEKINRVLPLLKEIGSRVDGTGGIPQSAITAVSGSGCQITFVYYVIKGADYLNTVHKVNNEILKRFEETGITLA
ncbi:MAG: mechanosensitive ion channel family protein [Spirochaetaceae bacterium]|jgi:MscS family membrane protein|nr:mechanosensitive ion channel family protein [Spirochaetaceae bacterium]